MTAYLPSAVTHPEVAVESCDVCIVGAGIAGLNALFVAGQYLSRDQEGHPRRPQGARWWQWVDTYPYVRLHQPHQLFTAGNMKWTPGRDRSYLATKVEVLDQFAHCLNTTKHRVQATSTSAGRSSPTTRPPGSCASPAVQPTAGAL